MRAISAIVLLTIAISTPVLAADKQQLAAKIFDTVVLPQVEPVVDRMLLTLVREQNPPTEVVKIYKETILEVMRHPEYREAYISAYTNLFSEQELSQAVELAQNPAFVAFIREGGNITQLTYPTFVKLNSAAKENLEKRLSAAGLDKWK
jgi:citrate lyase beta subunit